MAFIAQPVNQPLLTGALSAFDWLLIKFILIARLRLLILALLAVSP